MNHNCHGDYLEPLKLYRCLLDSTFTEIDSLPDECPNCGREVCAIVHKTVVHFTRHEKVVVIDNNEFVVSSSIDAMMRP